MLFDLRGSGRRRVVKIVYITLAFLMGGGLVLFGIGGGGALSGGLVDAITESEGGGERHRAVRERGAQGVRGGAREPERPGALGRGRPRALQPRERGRQRRPEHRRVHRTPASASSSPRARPGRSTSSSRATSPTPTSPASWSRPTRSCGQYDKATTAQEVIALDRGSVGAYTQLAVLAYQAGQLRKGDLARDKALKLTEPDMRESLKGQLEGARSQAALQAGQGAESPAPTPTPTPEEK